MSASLEGTPPSLWESKFKWAPRPVTRVNRVYALLSTVMFMMTSFECPTFWITFNINLQISFDDDDFLAKTQVKISKMTRF